MLFCGQAVILAPYPPPSLQFFTSFWICSTWRQKSNSPHRIFRLLTRTPATQASGCVGVCGGQWRCKRLGVPWARSPEEIWQNLDYLRVHFTRFSFKERGSKSLPPDLSFQTDLFGTWESALSLFPPPGPVYVPAWPMIFKYFAEIFC